MGTKLKRLSYIILTSMSIALDLLQIHSEFRCNGPPTQIVESIHQISPHLLQPGHIGVVGLAGPDGTGSVRSSSSRGWINTSPQNWSSSYVTLINGWSTTYALWSPRKSNDVATDDYEYDDTTSRCCYTK